MEEGTKDFLLIFFIIFFVAWLSIVEPFLHRNFDEPAEEAQRIIERRAAIYAPHAYGNFDRHFDNSGVGADDTEGSSPFVQSHENIAKRKP